MRYLVLALSFLISSNIYASGTRHLLISKDSIADFYEIKLSAIHNLHYLGHTNDWLIFGLTESDASGGMPWNYTTGYKIAKNTIEIKNGWLIDLNDKAYSVYVDSCPQPSLSSEDNILVIDKLGEFKRKCELVEVDKDTQF
ncbi:hypothetical protein [Microbulbifer sp. TYP-18]|uniref:hypothetical protein n=1 Tax=Microbulbifer sp. TYP-18 TaxID=3230024 RepID=UPI0034C5D3E0